MRPSFKNKKKGQEDDEGASLEDEDGYTAQTGVLLITVLMCSRPDLGLILQTLSWGHPETEDSAHLRGKQLGKGRHVN